MYGLEDLQGHLCRRSCFVMSAQRDLMSASEHAITVTYRLQPGEGRHIVVAKSLSFATVMIGKQFPRISMSQKSIA